MIDKCNLLLPLALLGLLVRCGGSRSDVPLEPLAPLVTREPRSQTVKAPATATFSATVSGTPAPACQWSLNGTPIPGATADTYTTSATDSSMNGNGYALTATNSLGSVTTGPAFLTVNGPPVITTQPAGATVALGGTATFSVAAAGTGGLTYQWSRSGSTIDGATAAAYTTPAATTDMNGGTYGVTVTSPAGTATSVSAPLTVAWGPTIKTQPASQNLIAPEPATFTVEAEGNPLTYQWNRNGMPMTGAVAATWPVPVTTIAMNGDVYTVTVTCAGNSVTSGKAVLNVSGAPVITTQPQAQSLLAGAALKLGVAAAGVPAVLTYQWHKDGSSIPGATSATYAVASVSASDAGAYHVTVSNGVGSGTQSATVNVTVAAGYAVSGQVTSGGAPVPGATLSIATSPAKTATTDAAGTYTIPDVPPGTYTLTPSFPTLSSVFLPTTRSVTVSADNVTADFAATLGYTVSGLITDPDPQPGTLYLALQPAGGGSALGAARLDISSGNAFAFKGVPPGTYALTARTDLYDKGVANGGDPTGALASTITVAGKDVTGVVLPLAHHAPDLSALAGPAFTVSPLDSGVVIDYRPVMAGGVEQAKFYEADWSTDSSFAALAGSRRFAPSPGHLQAFASGFLVNGATYHFRMRAWGATTSTAASTAAAPVTVGAAAGGITASGTVTFATPPTGPLFAGLRDPATGRTWLTRIPAPVSPQAFSVGGLPPGSGFELVAFLDQDGNGLVSFGDPVLVDTTPGPLSGDLPGLEVALPSTSCTVEVTTRHTRTDASGDLYTLIFTLRDGVRHVASALLVSGPKVPVPASLGTNSGGTSLRFEAAAAARPAAGDTYEIQVTYHDGTTETLLPRVTGVLDAFASDLAPTGTGDGTGAGIDVKPVFTWTAPADPPASFHYTFTLEGAGASWSVSGVPAADTALAWPTDPGDASNAPAGTLTVGTPYGWTVSLVDAFGNSARTDGVYTP